MAHQAADLRQKVVPVLVDLRQVIVDRATVAQVVPVDEVQGEEAVQGVVQARSCRFSCKMN